MVEKGRQSVLAPKMALSTENTDLTMYINSKLMYIEQAYKREISKLYTDAIQRRCQNRREILKNRLLLAPLTPSALSNLIQSHMGYLGKVMGEVLYIVQCTPKVAKIRRTEFCYNELPITILNQSMFMSPVTHIIQRQAEQIECSSLLAPLYFVDNEWVGLSPHPVERSAPHQLQPQESHRLQFTPIQPVGVSGLYTQEEISKVQRALAFGEERAAVANILARRIAGLQTDNQGYSTLQMFNSAEVKNLARSTLVYIWGWFTGIGMVMSGVIGIYVVIKGVKYISGVILNGVAIYKTIGCGFSILASFWNTLAVWLVHRHHTAVIKMNNEAARAEEGEAIEMNPPSTASAQQCSQEGPSWTKFTDDTSCPFWQPPQYQFGSRISLQTQQPHWTEVKQHQ